MINHAFVLVMILTTPLTALTLKHLVNTSLSYPIVQILSCMALMSHKNQWCLVLLLLYNNDITSSGLILIRTKYSTLFLGTEMFTCLTCPVMSLQSPLSIKLLGKFLYSLLYSKHIYFVVRCEQGSFQHQ